MVPFYFSATPESGPLLVFHLQETEHISDCDTWHGSAMAGSGAFRNLPFSKWEQIFKDPMTTAAAIDRLVHHSIILELNISSYRLAESKKGKK